MDTRRYEVLLEVARLGNITKTADKLGYTQSGVTQMIKSMEDEFGLALIDRNNKGVSLTPEGSQLLPLFREAVSCQERIDEEVSHLHGLETGRLSIGSYASIAVDWLPKVIKEFNKEHPGIKINIFDTNLQSTALSRLKSGELDIVFCRDDESENLEWTPIAKDRYLVVMSEKNPLSKKKRVPLKDLLTENILGQATTEVTDIDTSAYPIMKELNKRVTYIADLDESLHVMTMNNIGVMMSTDLMYSIRLKQGVVARPITPEIRRTLGYFIRSRDKLSLAAKAFLDCTHRVLK